MKRQATAVLVVRSSSCSEQTAPLSLAGRAGAGRRARVGVRGVARGGSGGSGSWQSRNGNASGLALGQLRRAAASTSTSRRTTASGASRRGQQGPSTRRRAGPEREPQLDRHERLRASPPRVIAPRTNEGGYASVQGSASTSTGREASGQGAVGEERLRADGRRRQRRHEVQRAPTRAPRSRTRAAAGTRPPSGPHGVKVTTRPCPRATRRRHTPAPPYYHARRRLLRALRLPRRAVLLPDSSCPTTTIAPTCRSARSS